MKAHAAWVTLLVFGLTPLGVSATVIDNFEVGAYGPVSDMTADGNPGAGATQAGLSTSDVIGGERTASPYLTSGAGVTGGLILTAGDDGALVTVLADGSANLYHTWAGPGGAGLGGVDLTSGGHDRIDLQLSASAASGAFVSLLLTDTDGDEALYQPGHSVTGPLSMPYDEFYDPAGLTDFDSIDLITLSVGARATGEDAEITILDLRTAPEPGSLALLGLGMLVCHRRRRAGVV